MTLIAELLMPGQAKDMAGRGEGAAKQAADQGAGAAKGAIGEAHGAAKQAAGQVGWPTDLVTAFQMRGIARGVQVGSSCRVHNLVQSMGARGLTGLDGAGQRPWLARLAQERAWRPAMQRSCWMPPAAGVWRPAALPGRVGKGRGGAGRAHGQGLC
jgi:hypothetical protein